MGGLITFVPDVDLEWSLASRSTSSSRASNCDRPAGDLLAAASAGVGCDRGLDGEPVGADVTAGRVCWKALEVVRDREAMYGPPAEHWKRTAALITALLADDLKPGREVTAEQWGLIMVLEKVSRRMGPDSGMDQLVDIAGYADGLGRLEGSRSEQSGDDAA